MNYIAKKIEKESSKSNPLTYVQYELFKTSLMKDVDEIERQIPESVGFFTLEILEERKRELQSQIDDIDNKINSIMSCQK